MASSSSSSSKSESFDVFLSFRGVDTRRGFVSHLEKELKSKAIINTFKDDEKLQTGDRISNELIRAIENSKFALVIISKNYASSGWCLDELEKIIECGEKGMLTIVPIFYEVDPSDVRFQKGTFAEAFEKHNDRRSAEKVQKWRGALRKVASLSGKDSRSSPDDATLVSEIVGDISQRLISLVPNDFDGIFGMDAQLEALDPLLNMGSDDEVRMIGIWGMGGVGKTTIAEYLYSIHKCHFQFHCLIHNIKKIYSEQRLEKLLRLFLSKILKDEKFMLESTEIDSNTIKSRLCSQKVLAVLDDVDHVDQLEALAKGTTWFGLGSRIIVTTRDKALFIAHGMELVHEVRCLEYDDALSLFNHFAFGGKQVSDDFTELSKRALKLVKGLPLATKVLGNALRGRKIKEWKPIIHRLEKVPDKTIMDCLKVSYDVLDDRDKDIFLTIACLFSGEYKSHLSQLLGDEDSEVHRSVDDEDCEVDISVNDENCEVNTRINTLAEKALIDISEYGRVTVHDLIQDMAEEIMRKQSNNELGRRRSLRDPKEIYNVLAKGTGTEAIEGISLDMSKIKSFPMRNRSFENMPNLKFLVIRNTSRYRGDISQLRDAINHLPPSLKLLDWENCPLKTLPPTFEAEWLVDLRLPDSDVERLSVKDLCLEKLRRLEFRSCLHLKEIPRFPRNIVEIDLSETNIRGMPEIPNLPTLKIMNLAMCEMLLKIPDTIGNLTSLQTLNLESCFRLLEIPSSIGNLTALRKLNLSCCLKLASIPDAIGSLTNLKDLRLWSCKRLLEIPSTISNLSLVEELGLSNCNSIRRVPDMMGNFSSLTSIKLLGCHMLSEISSTIGNFTTLRDLCLADAKLESIPSTIGNLNSLEELIVDSCQMLMEIPSTIGDLRALKHLQINRCNKLGNLPNTIGNLNALEDLKLCDCSMLSEIPSSIGNLRALQSLYIENCEKLWNIPETIGNLTTLKELKLSGCSTLSEIPISIGNLRALQGLYMKNCEKLRSIPETIGNLTALLRLNLSGCTTLSEIPSLIGSLRALQSLYMENCEKLRNIPETIGNLTALVSLDLSGCTMLSKIPSSIGSLKNLTILSFSSCNMLDDISSIISNMTSLQKLSPPEDIDCIWKIIMELPSRNLFTQYYSCKCCRSSMGRGPEDVIQAKWEKGSRNQALEVLYLFRQSYDPKHVPCRCTIFSMFHDLRELSLCNLNLQEIPDDFDHLQSLQRLDLSGNDFEIIPASIKRLHLLEQLVLSHCQKIRSIPELSPGLKYLYANDCSSLESISNVYSHPFHELMLNDCFKLGEVPWQFIRHMIFSMPISKGEIETKALFSTRGLPTCFSHQSTEQRLTICCSQVDSGSKPMGFVTGIVVACGNLENLYYKPKIHCRLHSEGYQSKHISFDITNLSSHVAITSAQSDLLFVFSGNFGEENSCDMKSFHFDFELETGILGYSLFPIENMPQLPAIKGCGIRLCFPEDLQQAQSLLPLTSGIPTQDIDELVKEGKFSNLRSSDQLYHCGNLNSD